MVESYRNYFCVVPLHVRGTLLVSARSRSMTPLRISVVPKLQTLVRSMVGPYYDSRRVVRFVSHHTPCYLCYAGRASHDGLIRVFRQVEIGLSRLRAIRSRVHHKFCFTAFKPVPSLFITLACLLLAFLYRTMGQSQSRPEETPKKDRKKLKAPAEWRNDVDFQVVSPMSDISNPSQFRGRQFNQGTSTVR